MSRLSMRKQLEIQEQQAIRQLNEKNEELEKLKRQYSEMLRTGKQPEKDDADTVHRPMI